MPNQTQVINRAVRAAMARQAECKQITTSNQHFASNVAFFFPLHDDIDVGAGANERVGNRIKMQQFNMNIHLEKDAAVANTTCRILLVESKLAEPLVVEDVFAVDDVNSTYSLQVKSTGDLRILIDEYLTLDTYNPTWTKKLSRKLHEYVQWRGSTSTPATQAGGGLYLMYMSDATTALPAFTSVRTLCYVD